VRTAGASTTPSNTSLPPPVHLECISIHAEQGNRLFIPFFQGLLAEIEAQEDNGAPAALARIDAAMALAT
jgi:hypothetical protein